MAMDMLQFTSSEERLKICLQILISVFNKYGATLSLLSNTTFSKEPMRRPLYTKLTQNIESGNLQLRRDDYSFGLVLGRNKN